MDLWFQASQLKPFGRHREVWWVQRREGLAAGTTMSDIARDYAAALRGRFDAPMDVVGSSTGGAAALQLAADHPETVHRLVLLSSACRLGPAGRDAQRNLAQLLRQGRNRQASAQMMSMLSAGDRRSYVLSKLGWMLGLTVKGDSGVSDMLITIEAEDAFDLTRTQAPIRARTLIVAGREDRFYAPELFEETARRIAGAQLVLLPGRGHITVMNDRRSRAALRRFLA
jgi:pimeloyl-ACP methyl ester carboxylesterase